MPFVNPKHCPLCHSQDISIDYGMMDNDEDLPPEIEKGLTSFFFVGIVQTNGLMN